MRVLFIDPWCKNDENLYYYTTGFVSGISKYSDLVAVFQHKFTKPPLDDYQVKKFFFRYSSNMKRGKFRTIVRGLEYVYGYFKILLFTRKRKFDVIHIEWPLLYSVDAFFYKKLKKKCHNLTLKVHNVLPHSTGEKYVNQMRMLYDIADTILVHGESIKTEFVSYFPENEHKVQIQRYGMHANHDLNYDVSKVDEAIINRIHQADKVYLFYGLIHYDKGVDRLALVWNSYFANSNSILIVVGRINDSYRGFEQYEEVLKNCPNVLYIRGFVENNLLNYLISNSDMIFMPYRKGYMSAVAFTCAEFSKPVLSTNFGAMSEYIKNGETGIIVDNSEEAFARGIKKIEDQYSKSDLQNLGNAFHEDLVKNYVWDSIGKKLVEEVYSKKIR